MDWAAMWQWANRILAPARDGLRRFRLTILLGTVLAAGAFYTWWQWTPPAGTGQVVSFEIPQGATTQQIAEILANKGLIRNSFIFRAAALWGGQAGSLQAGTYAIQQGATIPEILDRIRQGKVTVNTVRVTIPEGFTIEQIADTLAKKGLVDRQRFLQEADNGTFDYDFVKEIPRQPDIRHRLEGYLFPDTYEIKPGMSEHEILDMMLKRFGQVVTPELRQRFQANGLSLHQAVTMASLVEREARVAKERPVIAGVMFNRLHQKPPMLLQIDATVQYAVGQKTDLLLKDLEVDSPYNTYKRAGLPPGPIAAPGLDSLQAVASPEKHEYLYYVTKKDGTGEHYFGKTLEEHNRNIALSEQNLKKGN
ncbi:endolytic transglycosylase MltG [Effusibacillus pohliae]|uniref:endolytic transglycosylase MltG n=1 Tax=Effusibacillus pohliae TaxID=232270 RepID=UPI000380DF54|nr:endolytic transglycosylase MltG [Effusibacillus pohliae]